MRGRNVSRRGILLIFDSGASLELKATQGINRAMSILFLGPKSFRDRTKGLLGTWNGDQDDDLTAPDGSVLSANASTQTIHEEFGQLCELITMLMPTLSVQVPMACLVLGRGVARCAVEGGRGWKNFPINSK